LTRHCTRTYRSALDETLTPDARAVVERNYADEQRHLAWIEGALDSKLYEKRAAKGPGKAA
jgi:rubrerythrin